MMRSKAVALGRPNNATTIQEYTLLEVANIHGQTTFESTQELGECVKEEPCHSIHIHHCLGSIGHHINA